MTKLKQISTLIDFETGEERIKEIIFIKRNDYKYSQIDNNIMEWIGDLTGSETQVLLIIHSKAEWETNIIRLSKQDKQEICKVLNIQEKSLYNIIHKLKQKNFILVYKGQDIVNPEYFWNGSVNKKFKLINEMKEENNISLVNEEQAKYNKK